MHTTSVTLLQRLRAGQDPDAWPRLVRLYTPLLMTWAQRAQVQDNDAADLIQEVFAILLKRLPEFQYDPQGSFRSWLKTITMNKLRDWRRRNVVRSALPLHAIDEPADDDPAELFWERDYHQVLLRDALNLIRPEFAETVWAMGSSALIEERSPKDIAAKFGTTENAVYIAKCRVRRRMKEVLEGLWEVP